MVKTNKQPVFRIQFTVSAKALQNAHDREGVEIADSRQRAAKDFFNPSPPQEGQRAALPGSDELEITDSHFDPDRDLWIVEGAEMVIAAAGQSLARQELDTWLRQLTDAGWTVMRQAGITTIVEIPQGPAETDYGDTELAGP